MRGLQSRRLWLDDEAEGRACCDTMSEWQDRQSEYERAVEVLGGLGAQRLAVELVELSYLSEEARVLVDRLLASADQEALVALFHRRLAEIKGEGRYYKLAEEKHFFCKLDGLLNIVREVEAERAMPLLVALYEADDCFVGQADGSGGRHTFFYDSVDALLCEKMKTGAVSAETARDSIQQVLKEDDYGFRMNVGSKLAEALGVTEEALRRAVL